MGAFYANLCVKGIERGELVDWLSKNAGSACISKGENGWLCFATEELDHQDEELLYSFGTSLSQAAGRRVIGVINHDDDLLFMSVFENGSRVAYYNSTPDYWNDAPGAGEAPPKLEGLNEFAALGDDVSATDVRRILMAELDDYVFATERHADFVAVVKLPKFSVSTGYRDVVLGVGEADWTVLQAPTEESNAREPHGHLELKIGRPQNPVMSFVSRLLRGFPRN